MTGPWLSIAVLAPLAVAIACWLPIRLAGLRIAAVAAAGAALLAALLAHIELVDSGLAALRDPFDPIGHLLGEPVFAADRLNSLLVPFGALLAFVLQLAAPRLSLSHSSIRRTMIGLAMLLGSFACVSGIALAGFWCATILPVWFELRDTSRCSARVFAVYMGTSAVALIAGFLLADRASSANAHGLGAALLIIAVLARKGIAPFHSWMPGVFERANLATATLFSAPQLGAYVALRMVTPVAPDGLLIAMGSAALFTAVYGAGLALVQSDGRRAYGFLFMSQSALVLVGLDCTSEAGLAGGLVWWLASGLSLTGHGIALWYLEARRGDVSLLRHAGGYERMPLLAASFLIFGLASVGFPGTLGFVGNELLVGGAVERFPHAGFAVLIATGLNAVTVLRMYFRLFCGRRVDLPGNQRLRRREAAALAPLLAAVFATGLWPAPFVHSRSQIAADLLRHRDWLGSGSETGSESESGSGAEDRELQAPLPGFHD